QFRKHSGLFLAKRSAADPETSLGWFGDRTPKRPGRNPAAVRKGLGVSTDGGENLFGHFGGYPTSPHILFGPEEVHGGFLGIGLVLVAIDQQLGNQRDG